MTNLEKYLELSDKILFFVSNAYNKECINEMINYLEKTKNIKINYICLDINDDISKNDIKEVNSRYLIPYKTITEKLDKLYVKYIYF